MIIEDLILLSNVSEGWIAVYSLEFCTTDQLPKLIQMTERIDVLKDYDYLSSVQPLNWNPVTNEFEVRIETNKQKFWQNIFTLKIAETEWKQSTTQVDPSKNTDFRFNLLRNTSRDFMTSRINSTSAECVDSFNHQRTMVPIESKDASFVQIVQNALNNMMNIRLIGQPHFYRVLIVMTPKDQVQEDDKENKDDQAQQDEQLIDQKVNPIQVVKIQDSDERSLLLLREPPDDSQRLVYIKEQTGQVNDFLNDTVSIGQIGRPPKNPDSKEPAMFACATVKHHSRIVTFDSVGVCLYDEKFNNVHSITYQSVNTDAVLWDAEGFTNVELYYVDESDVLVEKSDNCPIRFWRFTDDKIQLLFVQTELGPNVYIEGCWTRINQARRQTIHSSISDHLIQPISNLIIDWIM